MTSLASRCSTRDALSQYLAEIAADEKAGDISGREGIRLCREAVTAYFAYQARMAQLRDRQVTEQHAVTSRSPRSTSAAAARSVEPRTGNQRGRLLAYLADLGDRGATDAELSAAPGLFLSSIRPRRV